MTFEPASGVGLGLNVVGLPQTEAETGLVCTIPGVVAGHSQGVIWVYIDDLAEALDHEASVQVRVGLGSGKVLRSEQVPMADLLAFAGPRANDTTGSAR